VYYNPDSQHCTTQHVKQYTKEHVTEIVKNVFEEIYDVPYDENGELPLDVSQLADFLDELEERFKIEIPSKSFDNIERLVDFILSNKNL